ncbi:type VI secretion system baseplate subunit TssE [Pseudomonas soli]|uniref:Type VI secretion system baseplate subunit TssE n=1 Tax=Pseudomonas soli TaxID=1306993 RepID=A0A2V4I493_9PSED|nr:type VI secretion system baseplate subunit TssE [Pseudomonas soli]PYB76157.1 type VI secretion system baseplate subunit TssE [Pseudomonas soli]
MSSLFERMASGAPAGRRESTRRSIERIKRHLETLLNARQGCSQSSPDLGLRDFNGHDLGSSDLLYQVSADIQHTIARYEPRIHLLNLQGMPDADNPLELRFRLDCQVQVENHADQLQIELLVNGHNRYTQVR